MYFVRYHTLKCPLVRAEPLQESPEASDFDAQAMRGLMLKMGNLHGVFLERYATHIITVPRP